MNLSSNQRPGVYSQYDITSAYLSPRSGSYAAVVAEGNGGETGKVHAITGMAQLTEAFGPDTGSATMRGCVQILLQAGVTRVYAVAVEGRDYAAALALAEELDNVGAVVCDCADAAGLPAVKASALKSSAALRERLAYVGLEDADEAVSAAQSLNCERVVLCCPAVAPAGLGASRAVFGAAALAGRVLAQNDCTYSFSGEALDTVQEPAKLTEAQVQALLAAGVTVLEAVGGAVECVRALTTSTKSGGETDYSLRGLNAILCIDNVMQGIRAGLRASLRGIRLSTGSLQSIQSQVVVELAAKADSGVIEGFETPKVYSDNADPTVCVVELSFAVAHVVSQIHVTAHIQV